MRGNVAEARGLADAALALPDGPPAARMSAANGAGVLAGRAGRLRRGARVLRGEPRARPLERGAARGVAGGAATSACSPSTRATTRRRSAATRTRRRSRANWATTASLGLLLQNLGLVHAGAGNRAQAIALLEESLVDRRRVRRPGARRLDPAQPRARADRRGSRARPRAAARDARRLARDGRRLRRSSHCFETAAALAADPLTGAELWGAAGALRAAGGGDPPAGRSGVRRARRGYAARCGGTSSFHERRGGGRGAATGRSRRPRSRPKGNLRGLTPYRAFMFSPRATARRAPNGQLKGQTP